MDWLSLPSLVLPTKSVPVQAVAWCGAGMGTSAKWVDMGQPPRRCRGGPLRRLGVPSAKAGHWLLPMQRDCRGAGRQTVAKVRNGEGLPELRLGVRDSRSCRKRAASILGSSEGATMVGRVAVETSLGRVARQDRTKRGVGAQSRAARHGEHGGWTKRQADTLARHRLAARSRW